MSKNNAVLFQCSHYSFRGASYVWSTNELDLFNEICLAENKTVEDDEIRKQLKQNSYPTNIIKDGYRKINNSVLQDRNSPDSSTKFAYLRAQGEH